MVNIKPYFFIALTSATACIASANTQVPSYQIEVELPQITEGQYHRPYVAIWIEDEAQQAQKTLTVWMQKDKWLSDLKRFWRRVARSNRAIVDGVTGATKAAGKYQISWDGLNEQGQALKNNTNYKVCVEAVREKGGREILCADFIYNSKQAANVLTGEHEISQLAIRQQ